MCPTNDRLMNDQSHDQDDLTTGIFGNNIEYAQPRTAPKEFKPWHKPRKQFVRRKQWSALLRRLYENRGPRDPLRYLGLPGTDLIDLRYLHEQLCRDNDRQLCFLGFNTEAQRDSPAHIELNISLDEVRRLSNVDPNSPPCFPMIFGLSAMRIRSRGLTLSSSDRSMLSTSTSATGLHRTRRRTTDRSIQGASAADGYSSSKLQSVATPHHDKDRARNV